MWWPIVTLISTALLLGTYLDFRKKKKNIFFFFLNAANLSGREFRRRQQNSTKLHQVSWLRTEYEIPIEK